MSEDQQVAYDWLIGIAEEVKDGKHGVEDFDMEEFVKEMDLAILEL